MRPADADHLYALVQTLTRDQLHLLWRWIFMEWIQRAHANPYREEV